MKTTVSDDEVVLVLDTGARIESSGDEFEAGAEVRVYDGRGTLVAGWERSEWAEAPEQVMGAILRSAATALPATPTTDSETLIPIPADEYARLKAIDECLKQVLALTQPTPRPSQHPVECWEKMGEAPKAPEGGSG